MRELHKKLLIKCRYYAKIGTYGKMCRKQALHVRNYQEQTWGIYDNTQDSELAIHVCDAYYGDSDSLAHKCEVLKKPVMIENVDV